MPTQKGVEDREDRTILAEAGETHVVARKEENPRDGGGRSKKCDIRGSSEGEVSASVKRVPHGRLPKTAGGRVAKS